MQSGFREIYLLHSYIVGLGEQASNKLKNGPVCKHKVRIKPAFVVVNLGFQLMVLGNIWNSSK